MKAKDTVMKRVEVNKEWAKMGLGSSIPAWANYGEEHPTYKLLKAQAEITWEKATEFLDMTAETQYRAGKVEIGNADDRLKPIENITFTLPPDYNKCPSCGGDRNSPALTGCPLGSHYGSYCEG